MSTVRGRALVRRSRGERRVTYALKIVALIVFAAIALSGILGFLARIPSVTVILIGAVFFTYVIYPAVRFFHARGAPLMIAILLTYVSIAAVVAFGVAFVLPALVNDSTSLVHATPDFVHRAQAFVNDPRNPILMRLPLEVRAQLDAFPTQLATFAKEYGGLAAGRVLAVVASFFGLIATVVVIPVIAVYLIFEAPDLTAAVIRAFPLKAQPKAIAMMHDFDRVLGGFIRGQLTVGATIGACITVALLILHVKYAVLIGVAAGVFDVIPYVGAIVGFVPAVTLALLNDGWQHALIVAAVFALIFQAEGHFIAPRIVSDSVGLSPLMVIVAILIGGELAGIGGMFLAVPIAAILRVVLLHALPNVRKVPQTPVAPSLDDAAKVADVPLEERIAAKKAERVRT